jgi:tyrosyl-tRNA synthetase
VAKKVLFPPVNEQMNWILRGMEEVISEDELVAKVEKSYKTSTPLIVKQGFDPTAPDLHLGHAVSLRKLRQFQDLGHAVVFLIGDFTGMVGDPTDRSATRKRMTREDVEANAKTYREQVFKILDPEKTQIRFNSEWLGALNIYQFLDLTATYTVARMLERDDFSKRYTEGKPIAILEFLYPLMQGYDSVALRADIEMGGTDQKFNLLLGRKVQEEYGLEPQVVCMMPLLVGTDGVEKMSKSLGNHIGIFDSPNDMFGKTMSISDDMIMPYFRLCTLIPTAEMEQVEKQLSDGVNPRDIKCRLAKEIVKLYYSELEADAAEQEFERVFSAREEPKDMQQFNPQKGESKIWLPKLMVIAGTSSSNSEARRLISQGAVRLDGEKVLDVNYEIALPEYHVLQVGKLKWVEICPELKTDRD